MGIECVFPFVSMANIFLHHDKNDGMQCVWFNEKKKRKEKQTNKKHAHLIRFLLEATRF